VEIIKLNFPNHINKTEMPPLSIALGYFDGVHLGHQKVILEAKKTAVENGWKSAVMTFDPHPSVVLGKSVQHVEYITPLQEKINVISNLGIDFLFVVHFTADFANLLPQEFIDQYIINLNVKHLVAGFDYTYGRMGKGTMETIPFHSRGEFSFTIVPKMTIHEEKVSSTLIRQLLRDGRTAELPELLGRFYKTPGPVIHGDKRGRTIGFPTANIGVSDDYILPPLGVYAVKMHVKGSWYEGVCNIGNKPTFKSQAEKRPSVEVHLFNFDQDIYGEEAIVEWHQFIRREQKFSGINELVAQIEKDKQTAQEYFLKYNAHLNSKN
jgi:riboflavin kinase/FMN adenylyltransferase